ncbi:MAG: hypothetical protein ACKVOE_09565 [Rickettsiales bacterium]
MAVFPRTAAQFSELGSNFKNLGSNFTGSFSALGKSIGASGGKLGGLIDWSANSTVWAARQPVKFVSWTYKSFPVLASLATIGGGAIIAGSFLRNRAEKRTQREFEAQAASMPQAPSVQANSYQITPQEYAEMQSRMRDSMAGQGASSGHAERFLAAKQAAAAMPPDAAKPTADLAQL